MVWLKNTCRRKERKTKPRWFVIKAAGVSRWPSTHLLVWSVDDNQVCPASDAVSPAVVPVLFEAAVLGVRK